MSTRIRILHFALLAFMGTFILGLMPSRQVQAGERSTNGQTKSADREERAKAEIVALVDRFNKAINDGDVPGSVAVYDLDVESFPLFSMKYSTTAQRMAAAKRAADSGIKVTTKRNDDMKVHVIDDNWAWAHWTWHTVSVTPQGVRTEADGRTTFVLEKKNGEWRVVHSHISEPNRAAAPPQPAVRPSGSE